jgi:hypothetical protein
MTLAIGMKVRWFTWPETDWIIVGKIAGQDIYPSEVHGAIDRVYGAPDHIGSVGWIILPRYPNNFKAIKGFKYVSSR